MLPISFSVLPNSTSGSSFTSPMPYQEESQGHLSVCGNNGIWAVCTGKWSRTIKVQKTLCCVLPKNTCVVHLWAVLASSVRSSSKNSCGFFVQMHNASSSDLLWGGKSFKKIKEMLARIISLLSDRFQRGFRAERWVQVLILILWFVRFCCYISLVLNTCA